MNVDRGHALHDQKCPDVHCFTQVIRRRKCSKIMKWEIV